MILTIDIGNTTISLCLHTEEKVLFTIASVKEKTSDEYFTTIRPLITNHINLEDITSIALSSVVDDIKITFEEMIKTHIPQAYFLAMRPKLKTKIDIAIDNSNELGNDILASAIAVNKTSVSKNFCIIDLGTATSISLTSQNKFLGVVIMPGISKQLEALALTTSKLPKVTLQNIEQFIGKNTQDSILCGVLIGHAYAINGFVKKYQNKFRWFRSVYHWWI